MAIMLLYIIIILQISRAARVVIRSSLAVSRQGPVVLCKGCKTAVSRAQSVQTGKRECHSKLVQQQLWQTTRKVMRVYLARSLLLVPLWKVVAVSNVCNEHARLSDECFAARGEQGPSIVMKIQVGYKRV